MTSNPAIENLITYALSRFEGRTAAQIKSHVDAAAGRQVSFEIFGAALDRVTDRGIAIYIDGGVSERPRWSLA